MAEEKLWEQENLLEYAKARGVTERFLKNEAELPKVPELAEASPPILEFVSGARKRLLLCGPDGAGKSTYAAALWMHFTRHLKMSGSILEFREFCNLYREGDAETGNKIVARCRPTYHAVENVTADKFGIPALEHLLDWRKDHELYTVVTTSVDPENFDEQFGVKFAKTLRATFIPVFLGDPSLLDAEIDFNKAVRKWKKGDAK